jgi:hypothetical protein
MLFGTALCALGFTSAHGQQTWTTRHHVAGGSFLWGVTRGAAGLVAVGTGGKILTSLDGEAWTVRTSATDRWLTSVGYGNDRYVAVGEDGIILTSTDARSWTKVSVTGTTSRLNKVVFGDGRWIAVGENAAMVTSTDDARTWTAIPAVGFNGWLRGLAHVSGAWVVVGQRGEFGFSNDGAKWTRRPPQTTQDLESAVYVSTTGYSSTAPNGIRHVNRYHEFLAAGSDGTTVRISYTHYQGLTVVATQIPSQIPITARIRGLTAALGLLLATAERGQMARAAHQLGPWVAVDSGSTRTLTDSVYALDEFFAVGEDETILRSEPVYPGRLSNVATRGFVGLGDSTMIAGTYISGAVPKQMLIRAIGPSLADFGILTPLADPVLTVLDQNGVVIATNRGWTENINYGSLLQGAARVGAFPLDPARADSALIVTLPPGPHTFQVRSATGRTGVALIEAYDIDSAGRNQPRMVNLSTRLQAGVNENVLIAGLVIGGSAARTVLIRGVGPALTRFGVAGVLVDPMLRVVHEGGALVAENNDWGTATVVDGRSVTAEDIREIGATLGAFPFDAGSRDSALLLNLPPGNYTLQVSGVGGLTGVALVEAYELP